MSHFHVEPCLPREEFRLQEFRRSNREKVRFDLLTGDSERLSVIPSSIKDESEYFGAMPLSDEPLIAKYKRPGTSCLSKTIIFLFILLLLLSGLLLFLCIEIKYPDDRRKCPANYTFFPETGYCYKVSIREASFEGAERTCLFERANLVSIHSNTENELLNKFYKDKFRFYNENIEKNQKWPTIWIGLINLGGRLVWTDGSEVDYTNWAAGEPNNLEEGELFTEMVVKRSGGWSPNGNEWNNVDSSGKRAFFCKKTAFGPAVSWKFVWTTKTICEGLEAWNVRTLEPEEETATIRISKPTDQELDQYLEFAGSARKSESVTSFEGSGMISENLYDIPAIRIDKNGTLEGSTEKVTIPRKERNPTLETTPSSGKDETEGSAESSEENDLYDKMWLPSDRIPIRISVEPVKELSRRRRFLKSAPQCSSGYSYFNDFCYKVYPIMTIFEEARQKCARDSAFLASIHSKEENDFVVDLTSPFFELASNEQRPRLWIGLVYSPLAEKWIWENGCDVDYTNWLPNEPNHLKREHWASISLTPVEHHNPNGTKWTNHRNMHTDAFVCKKMPMKLRD